MNPEGGKKLQPYLSPAGAWALSLGTGIGWGSLVITGSTYLLKAGPAGTVAGLIAGALIMLVIARCYHYMMGCYPEAGGAYSFAKYVFGYDFGFLAAWFMLLTYLSMLWANATALPLFARYFLGQIFHFGRLYTVFGYDVYFGEVLLTDAAILLAGLLCAGSKKTAARLLTGMAVFLTAGILVCSVFSLVNLDISIEPHFIPGSSAVWQAAKIAFVSPWAFVGFENISHATEEFSFPRSRAFRILLVSVISSTALYILVSLLSVTAYPPEYDSWVSYIRESGSLNGIKGIPAFYAADYYMGSTGVLIMMITLLCLIGTSLIGNILALSRLLYAMAEDRIIPDRFAALNAGHTPANAIYLIVAGSMLVPFIGRTAVGWIVDVTTIGATILYATVSASAAKLAAGRKDIRDRNFGIAGLVIMLVFGAYLLLPNLFTTSSMATESYFLFVVWAILGFAFFRYVLKNDSDKRFGQSIVVWIALLSLVLFVSLVWMNQSMMNATVRAMDHILQYYSEAGIDIAQSALIADEIAAIRMTNARSIIVVVILIGISLAVLLNNYSVMRKRAQESESQLDRIWTMANTDPLTGVRSKHAFAEKEKKVDAQIADNTPEEFAVAVCDVNNLKKVNDTYGHNAGDAYIKAASAIICEVFRHSPVYRTGGDEFVVYLVGRDYEARQNLLREMHDKSVANIGSGSPVISVGMSDFRKDSDGRLRAVLERADAGMYEEKKSLKSMEAKEGPK